MANQILLQGSLLFWSLNWDSMIYKLGIQMLTVQACTTAYTSRVLDVYTL